MVRRVIAAAMAGVLLLALFAGCSSHSKYADEEYLRSDKAVEDVQLVDDPAADVTLPEDYSLGDVTFETDTGKAVTGEMPMAEALVLTTADASGAKWTLTIPAHAVPAGTVITMTPLGNIQSAGYIGSMKGGLLLEPDGLTFDTAGTLEVKLPSGSPKSVLLTGDQTGKGINLMGGEPGEGTVVSPIDHFSSKYFDTVENLVIKGLQEQTEQDFKELLSLIGDFIETPIKSVAPPDISLEDFKDSRYEEAKTFAYRAMQPEESYLQQLVILGRTMALLSNNYDKQSAMSEEVLSYAKMVAKRMLVKADRMLRDSNQDPLKFLATAVTVLVCYKDAALFGLEPPAVEETLLPYAKETADFCCGELKNKHNYKYIRACLELGRICAGFGDQSRYEKALAAAEFKVSYEAVDKEINQFDNYVTTITGACSLVPEIENDNVTFYGNGALEYSFDWTNLVGDTFTFTVENTDYHVEVTKFDPGDTNSIELAYDRLFSDHDVARAGTEYGYTYEDSVINAHLLFENLMNQYTAGSFPFTLPLQNFSQTAGVTTVNYNDGSGFSIDMTVKFIHTPE